MRAYREDRASRIVSNQSRVGRENMFAAVEIRRHRAKRAFFWYFEIGSSLDPLTGSGKVTPSDSLEDLGWQLQMVFFESLLKSLEVPATPP